MADAFLTVKYDEKLPVYSGAWTPTTGTETLVSVACTLRDAQGVVAGGVSASPATGFDAGAQAAPTAYLNMDLQALALPEPTYATGQSLYTLEFLATDAAGNRYASVVVIVVKPRGS